MIKTKNSGFTLIELLVVISIIGMLSSVVLVSLNQSRDKAKIAVGIQELNQIRTAITAYLIDQGDYPPMLQPSNAPHPSGTLQLADTLIPDLVSSKYLSATPKYITGRYIHKCTGSTICNSSKSIQDDTHLLFHCGSNPLADAVIEFNVYNVTVLPNYKNTTMSPSTQVPQTQNYNILCLYKN